MAIKFTLANGGTNEDAYVVGLLLALIIASAVPVLSTGVTWLALLLLFVTWSSVYAEGKA